MVQETGGKELELHCGAPQQGSPNTVSVQQRKVGSPVRGQGCSPLGYFKVGTSQTSALYLGRLFQGVNRETYRGHQNLYLEFWRQRPFEGHSQCLPGLG